MTKSINQYLHHYYISVSGGTYSAFNALNSFAVSSTTFDTVWSSVISNIGSSAAVVGWTYTYAPGGGYGALTDPCPATTTTSSNIPILNIRCSA